MAVVRYLEASGRVMTRSEADRRMPKWVGRRGGQLGAWGERTSGRNGKHGATGELELNSGRTAASLAISVVTTDSFLGFAQGSSDRQQSIHSPTYYHLCLALFSPLLRSPSGMASRSPDTHIPSAALQDESARQDSKQKDSLDRGEFFFSLFLVCRFRAEHLAFPPLLPRALSDHTCTTRCIDLLLNSPAPCARHSAEGAAEPTIRNTCPHAPFCSPIYVHCNLSLVFGLALSFFLVLTRDFPSPAALKHSPVP